MLESLDIVSETAGNRTVADAIQDSKQGVREGRSLAQELEGHAVMPALVTQMVQVGEQTGALDAMLQKVADFYNNEVDATVNSLTSIL
jgi:type IV pilus assembly protein PilC